MAVDVVVVNFHTYDLLDQFCKSYDKQKFDGCTLTVVDVEGVGTLQPSLAPCSWDDAISFQDNVGFGRACNEGAAMGLNDAILLANADTVLSEGFRQCYDALMFRDDWGVLGPRQVNEHGQLTFAGIFGPDQAPKLRGWKEADIGQYSDVRDDTLSVMGSLYFVKRSVWEELTACALFQIYQPGSTGAFLETPHYFEEMFCSLHARAHGHKCVYYGPVQMLHYWHAASAVGGWADQQFARSQAMHREACRIHGIASE